MNIILDLSLMSDVVGSMEDIPCQVNRSIENPLIVSLREIPRESMEEPEVEYFVTPSTTESKDEFAECEVLS